MFFVQITVHESDGHRAFAYCRRYSLHRIVPHVTGGDHGRVSIGTIGTARAQYHLRQIFVFLNPFPINQPECMIGNAASRFDAEGNLTDDATKGFIRELLKNLVDWTRRLGQPRRT